MSGGDRDVADEPCGAWLDELGEWCKGRAFVRLSDATRRCATCGESRAVPSSCAKCGGAHGPEYRCPPPTRMQKGHAPADVHARRRVALDWLAAHPDADGAEHVSALLNDALDLAGLDDAGLDPATIRAAVDATQESTELVAGQAVAEVRRRAKVATDLLLAVMAERTRERDEARGWVRRLTNAERVLTCAFCGEAYPPGTPETNHDRLTEHVKVCTKHPMRNVERDLDAEKRTTVALLGKLDEVRRDRDNVWEQCNILGADLVRAIAKVSRLRGLERQVHDVEVQYVAACEEQDRLRGMVEEARPTFRVETLVSRALAALSREPAPSPEHARDPVKVEAPPRDRILCGDERCVALHDHGRAMVENSK